MNIKNCSRYARMALYFVAVLLASCNQGDSFEDAPQDAVIAPADMNLEVTKALTRVLGDTAAALKRVSAGTELLHVSMISTYYEAHEFERTWSRDMEKAPLADSLLSFIRQARYYGLYPEDYHYSALDTLHKKLESDSVAARNSAHWVQLELFSTDAFFQLLKDLKEGRMVADSLSIAKNEQMIDSFFVASLTEVRGGRPLSDVLHAAEPTFFKYTDLRNALPDFVDHMDPVQYPQIVYPFTDSFAFVREVYTRLRAQGFATDTAGEPGEAAFSAAVKHYQASRGLTADGKPGARTIREMNHTDDLKFRSIAISLDRYKQMPEMPETFIWVNVPSFHLQVFDEDTLRLRSRIIVGKPATPTPELVSRINNLVVYPNWTIPASIIRKEILPALKKNPDYLSEKGYNLFDEKGDIINPYGVNWARYNTGIPWKVVQGSGDDNALGVFKFNFNNPYSVYLHDTNQRYLFANENRALSHGCVRVQKWQELADIIAVRDSILSAPNRLNYSEDSLRSWVRSGVRKTVTVRNRFPLYIVYVTSDVQDGRIDFHTDIYNDDARLYTRYFRNRK